MNIIRCDDSFRQAWNDFIESGYGSFYHRFEWRDINASSFGHQTCYLAAIDDGRIAGLFPLVQVKSRLFGNIACSLPFVNFGGPTAATAEAEEALLLEAEQVAAEWGVDYVEIRSRKHLGGRLPASESKVSMTVDLNADSEVLWKAFKTGHRQDIRKAYKNGMSAKIGGAELLDDFYAVLSESWRDLGTPFYRKSYLERVLTTFPKDTRVTVVYAGTEPAAASLDGIQSGIVEGMYLGMRARHRHHLPGYVLYWENIKDACERGLKRFHLGRSTAQSGSEAFKKKWNAETVQLYWHYILRSRDSVPALNVQNPRFALAIKAWQKLPLPVTRLVGPLVSRSIP